MCDFRIAFIQNVEPEQQRLLVKTEENLNFGSLLVNYLKATFQLLLGIAILAVLAMPYLKTVGNFSTAANIPQFFVPYVIIPFALNYRRAMFFINSAREKTRSSISLTLSEVCYMFPSYTLQPKKNCYKNL